MCQTYSLTKYINFIFQPTSDKDHKTRKETEINIDNFKNFHARRRWKHSMKVVALCNKLTRSRTLLKDGAAGFGVVTDPIEMLPKSVVSNMTTGKKLSREVRNFFSKS